MGRPRRADLLLFATALALPLHAAAQGAGGRTIYCCEDNSGRPVCGDVLPMACYGKAYREISPQGTVRRHVAAPLTAEEIARRQAEERRRRFEEAREMQQRRLDQALLETYASLEDLDTQRDRALNELNRQLEELNTRMAELDDRRFKLEQEREFYDEDKVPRELAADLRVAEGEVAAQRAVIDAKTRELNAVRSRFDDDRRRYVELTLGSPPGR